MCDPAVCLLLAGMPKAGKTRVAKLLEGAGYQVESMSGIIKEGLLQRGLPLDWRSVAAEGERIRSTSGTTALAAEAWRRVQRVDSKRVCIDGVRSIDELWHLRTCAPHSRLLFVHASPDARYNKLLCDEGRTLSREAFAELDRQNVRLGLGELATCADYVMILEDYFPLSIGYQLSMLLSLLDPAAVKLISTIGGTTQLGA